MTRTTIGLMTLLLWLVLGASPVAADPGDLLQVYVNPVGGNPNSMYWPVATGGDRVFLADLQGSVHMFDKATGDLLRSYVSPTSYNGFGRSIATTDEHVFMIDDGAVFKYDYHGNLLQTVREGGTPFGWTIAAAGNKLAVGDAGRAPEYAQVFDTTTGQLLFSLERLITEGFSYSMAFVDGNLLVGAPNADYAGVDNAGKAYLFDGTTGALLNTFVDPNPTEGGRFGWSVASLGSKVVIAASARTYLVDPPPTSRPGVVYSFEPDLTDPTGQTWNLAQTFNNPRPGYAGEFGHCIAAVGPHVLVGDPHAQWANGVFAGAAYLFDGLTGDLLETYANPAPYDFQDSSSEHTRSDHFGAWVAAAGTDVLVVAGADDTYGVDTRTAYLFEGPVVPEPGTLVLLASGGFGLLLGAIWRRGWKARNERKPCRRPW